jgi:hypothetical protein
MGTMEIFVMRMEIFRTLWVIFPLPPFNYDAKGASYRRGKARLALVIV